MNEICKDPVKLLLPLLLEPNKGDGNQANNYENELTLIVVSVINDKQKCC